MNLVINSKELLASIKKCRSIVTKSMFPQTETIQFTCLDGRLRLSATDTQNTIYVWLEVPDAKPCQSFCVDAYQLTDLLSSLPEQPVELKHKEHGVFVIKAQNGEYSCASEPGDIFNEPCDDLGTPHIILNEAFVAAVSSTMPYVSKDDLRMAMTGVYFDQNDSGLSLVATDAHMLAYSELDDKGDVKAIVPTKILNTILNVCKNGCEGSIQINQDKIRVVFEDIQLEGVLIDGKYPDYNAILPDQGSDIVVNRKDLLSSINRLSIFADDNSKAVVFNIGESLVLKSNDPDYGNSASEEISITNSNNVEIKIGFNSSFMAKVLKSIHTDDVIIEVISSNKAAYIKPIESEDFHLLMPLMI